ncbi:DUF4926 domain-containing protein [Leptolyngbya ohadii]|uniref:DUF4926 domain-containing protein n=1 Tax=Leptolyngbya ohadii TaxID=1962290 RepID=UPI0021F1F190|nr:DUF4926 domain-containing protein [Leptolyngbya ohadii]
MTWQSDMADLQLLNPIANLKPIPVDRLTLVEPEYEVIEHLPVGQVGTIVEIYEAQEPRYLIEFADLQGREYAMAVLQADEFIVLHYQLESIAGA